MIYYIYNLFLNLISCDIHVRYGCEVPGMILLFELKGAMQFDHSKDMSVHVSACTS